MSVTGLATASQGVALGTVATVFAACAPNGAVAASATGLTLSCQSGVWQGEGVGAAQTWQDFSCCRGLGGVYGNFEDRPIMVSVSAINGAGGANLFFIVNGVIVDITAVSNDLGGGIAGTVSGIVPPGSAYEVWSNIDGTALYAWSELR